MNRADFLVDSAVLKEAKVAMDAIPGKYREAIDQISAVTAELLRDDNWKGKTKTEFQDTYSIVSRYLEDDQQQMGSIVDILQGFYNLYDAADIDTAKSLIQGIEKLSDKEE